MARFLSCRNQFIDLHSKSRDWFLYDRYLRHERVKHFDSLKLSMLDLLVKFPRSNTLLVSILFFNGDSLHARLSSHYETWSYKKKKLKKINAYRKSVYKAPTVERCLLVRAIIFILRIWMLSFSVTQKIVLLRLHTRIMDEEFTTDERTIEIGCIRSSIQVKKVSTFPVHCFVVVFSNFHFEQVNTGWVDWRKDLSFKIWLLVIIFLININIDRHLETKIPFFLEVFAECTYLHYKKSSKQPSSDLILWSLMRNTQVILKVLTFARHSVKLPRLFSFQWI